MSGNSQAQMSPPAIFIATHDAEDYVPILRERLGGAVEINTGSTEDDAVRLYGDEPVLLARPDFALQILYSEPPLQWLQSSWAGVTPLINHAYKDYQLTGVKDVFGEQMGEYVLAYILAHELRIHERRLAQLDRQWHQSSSSRVAGKTLGVMGTGSIGAYVANMAKQLNLRVLGFNSTGKPVEPFERVYDGESLETFLSQCDYLVGILPDVSATTDLINRETLSVMKESALIINVGRGNLIDEEALAEALGEREVAGAVLDVFKCEPLPAESPLWDAPNCTITAHVAAVSNPQDIARLFLENYERFVAGESLLRKIDFDQGY